MQVWEAERKRARRSASVNSCLTPKRGVIDNSTHSDEPSNKCLDTLIEVA